MKPPAPIPPPRLALTHAPQDAVFYVRPGFVGGAGSTPVVDRNGEVVFWNDLRLFLDEDTAAAVVQVLARRGTLYDDDVIVVAARVRIEERSGSLAGLRELLHRHRHYAVLVERLDHVTVHGGERSREPG